MLVVVPVSFGNLYVVVVTAAAELVPERFANKRDSSDRASGQTHPGSV